MQALLTLSSRPWPCSEIMLRCGGSSHHFAAPGPPGEHSAKPESSRLSGSPGSKPPPDVGKRQKKKRVFFFRRTLDFARILDGPDSVAEFVVRWGQSKVLLNQSPQL